MENTFEHADLFQEELDGAANLIDSVVDLEAPILEEEPPEEREAVAVKEPEYEVPDTPATPELSGETRTVRGKEYPVEYFYEKDGKYFWKPEHKPGSGFIYGSGEDDADLIADLSFAGNEIARNLSFAGAGIMDFGVDLATTVGNRLGLNVEGLNKQWDALTKQVDPSPERQKLRKFASVVIPTMMGTRQATMGIQATALPGAVKGVATVGSAAAIDAAVIGVSDEGLEDNGARMLADTFPTVFGTNGAYPIPDSWKTLDSDSPAVRKQKNMQESIGLSLVGDFLGFTMGAGKKVLDWFIPKSDSATAYKAAAVAGSDAETVSRIAEIEQALATKPSQANAKVLQEERDRLLKQLEETGESEVTTKSRLERTVEQAEESRRSQMDEVAILKLEADPQGFGYIPEVTPGLAQPNQLARQSIPPGNVARNMGDTTAIKNGDVVGDPAPVLPEPVLKNGLVLGKSRNAVAGLAESSRAIGDFDANVDGFRYTRANMRDAAWNIYNDIIRAGSVDDVKKLFAADRDVKTLIDGTKVKYLNEVQQAQASQAITDLVDLYLGREVTESSARIMDTLGREIASMSEASVTYRDLVDDNRIQEMIADKLEYLMAEVGLNKYISGWQLQNKNIFQRIAKSNNPGELTDLINDEFQQALNARHASVKRFRKNLDQLKEKHPETAKAFYDAFSRTNGDVDTIEKLYKWADSQVSVLGMIKSPTKGQMNLFARGLWGVGMNNVLSGLSALNAAKGNVSNLIIKPITSILGHGIEAAIQRDIEPLKKAFYYHGAVFETQKRALQDGLTRVKATHQDYDFMMSQIREDYVIEDVKDWEILDAIASARQNDRGFQFQYNWATANRDVSRMKWMRTGMTGMSGVDAYTDTMVATHMSRLRAYDDVFTKHGTVTPELLAEAERANYSRMFNADGVLTDAAAKNASGEISLNLDDATSSYINAAVTAVPAFKPFFMFPKTSANDIKASLSYTPIAIRYLVKVMGGLRISKLPNLFDTLIGVFCNILCAGNITHTGKSINLFLTSNASPDLRTFSLDALLSILLSCFNKLVKPPVNRELFFFNLDFFVGSTGTAILTHFFNLVIVTLNTTHAVNLFPQLHFTHVPTDEFTFFSCVFTTTVRTETKQSNTVKTSLKQPLPPGFCRSTDFNRTQRIQNAKTNVVNVVDLATSPNVNTLRQQARCTRQTVRHVTNHVFVDVFLSRSNSITNYTKSTRGRDKGTGKLCASTRPSRLITVHSCKQRLHTSQGCVVQPGSCNSPRQFLYNVFANRGSNIIRVISQIAYNTKHSIQHRDAFIAYPLIADLNSLRFPTIVVTQLLTFRSIHRTITTDVTAHRIVKCGDTSNTRQR
jgi:hypothetical protein